MRAHHGLNTLRRSCQRSSGFLFFIFIDFFSPIHSLLLFPSPPSPFILLLVSDLHRDSLLEDHMGAKVSGQSESLSLGPGRKSLCTVSWASCCKASVMTLRSPVTVRSSSAPEKTLCSSGSQADARSFSVCVWGGSSQGCFLTVKLLRQESLSSRCCGSHNSARSKEHAVPIARGRHCCRC